MILYLLEIANATKPNTLSLVKYAILFACVIYIMIAYILYVEDDRIQGITIDYYRYATIEKWASN